MELSKMPEADFLVQKEEFIRQRIQRAAVDVWEIGKALLEVKEALPHGQFGKWIQEKFGWGHQTANNFMNVAKNFPEIPNGLEISHRALYLLAAPKTPQSLRQEALAIARNNEGEKLSERQVEGIVSVHAAVNSEPIADPKTYIYQGKRVYGRMGKGNDNYGWLEPGTEVQIASASLTDRSQRFVRLVDEPSSVFQVALSDLVEQYSLDDAVMEAEVVETEVVPELPPARPTTATLVSEPDLKVGDVVCLFRLVDKLVAELDDGVLIPSVNRGKITRIEGSQATVAWMEGNPSDLFLDWLAKLPARYQDIPVVKPHAEEDKFILSCREVLGEGMFVDPESYPADAPTRCVVGTGERLFKVEWNRFLRMLAERRIEAAIAVVPFSLESGYRDNLVGKADVVCLLRGKDAIALYFGKNFVRFKLEFHPWGYCFLGSGRAS